ncbi:hypothetical protein BDA96_03G144300 [Sorghum bicolor]|uniref:Uncharacterized protein n=1 Tax=Sorghum bicolor TaxID=4558 RepID=A0A921RDY2_SORBI|nr:hypothetical protein BDA96_03G144300 [Sorghum bicolor]
MTSGLPQQISTLVSKKFTFSVGLTEESYNSKIKRKYLIKSILARSDKRNPSLSISAPQAGMPTTPAPLGDTDISATLPDEGADTQTPAPASDTDQTPTKNLITDAPAVEATARRALFPETTESPKASMTTQQDEEDAPEPLLHHKNKRGQSEQLYKIPRNRLLAQLPYLGHQIGADQDSHIMANTRRLAAHRRSYACILY